MMLSTLLTGAVIAISFSAPPGPVTVETIRRGVRGGFRAALMVQLGSIVGDVTWCAAALIGLAPLAAIPWVRLPLGAIGVVVLVRLGAAGVREALWPSDQKPAVSGMGSFSEAGAFRSGMAISLANPMAVGYWISIGGVMLAAGVTGMSAGQTAAFVAGFVAGTVAWALLMAGCFRWLQGALRVGSPLLRAVTASCGMALIALGLGLGWQAFGPLL